MVECALPSCRRAMREAIRVPTEKIRAMIVDDEPFSRQRISALLAGEPDVEVIAQCADGLTALTTLQEQKPDLVFLGIQVPELNGFQVLEALDPDEIPAIIFVTANDSYAVRAFEVRAVDYLLKPFDADRFHRSLLQARQSIRSRRERIFADRLTSLIKELGVSSALPQRLIVKSSGSIRFVRVEEIDWIESAGNYVNLHVGGKSHLLRETMRGLESRLDPRKFVRIHRVAIVNVERIVELQPLSSGDYRVILEDGTELALGRAHVEKLWHALH